MGGGPLGGGPKAGEPLLVFTYTNSNNTRGEGAPMGGGHPRVGGRVAPRGAGTRRMGRL